MPNITGSLRMCGIRSAILAARGAISVTSKASFALRIFVPLSFRPHKQYAIRNTQYAICPSRIDLLDGSVVVYTLHEIEKGLFIIVQRLIHYIACLGLLLLLGACNWESTSPPPTSIGQPIATLFPTRGVLMTITPSDVDVPAQPSATPDPTVISEVFLAPHGVLSFRYPSNWVITDESNESEILVKAETLLGAKVESIFVVNLLNAKGELTTEALEALADTYLRNLLDSEFDPMNVSYRQEDGSLIATTIISKYQELQFEVRFNTRGAFYQVLTLIAPPDQWEHAALTLDAMARSVAVNKDMAAFIPTPSAAVARQKEGLSVQNASVYHAKTGALYVVGEVLNHSQQAYEDVQVILSLLDGNGTPLVRQPWVIERKLLPPNKRSPFVAIFNPPPEGWAGFDMTADGLPADFYAKRLSTAFEMNEITSFTPSSAAYGLMGVLKNNGNDARSIKVIGALYNQAGNVLSVSRTTLGQYMLPAGEEIPVELIFYTKDEGQPVNYQIWIEGTLGIRAMPQGAVISDQ